MLVFPLDNEGSRSNNIGLASGSPQFFTTSPTDIIATTAFMRQIISVPERILNNRIFLSFQRDEQFTIWNQDHSIFIAGLKGSVGS